MTTISGFEGTFNVDFDNVLRDDYNALLALLCFGPTFKALPHANESKSLLGAMLQLYDPQATFPPPYRAIIHQLLFAKNTSRKIYHVSLISSAIINTRTQFSPEAQNATTKDLSPKTAQRPIFSKSSGTLNDVLLHSSKIGGRGEPVFFELLELKHETITFVRDFEVM